MKRLNTASRDTASRDTATVLPKSMLHPADKVIRAGLALMLFATAFGFGLDASAQEPAKKIALLVGVSEYVDPGFDDLNYADNDASLTAIHLEAMGFETTVLTNDQATQEKIDQQLDTFLDKAEQLESDSVVFILFSGHGQQLKTSETTATGKRVEETPFFCPHDAIATDELIAELRGKSAKEVSKATHLVSLNSVLARLDERSNSLNNLIAVDACRSNPAKGKTPGITGSTVRGIPRGISLLFAARSGQRSWESTDPKIQNGVFTHYLLQALRGEAKNRRGQITWSGLTTYVSEEVSYEGWKLAGDKNRTQNAQAVINSDGVIVLGETVSENVIASVLYKNIDNRARLMRLADVLPDKSILKWPIYLSFLLPKDRSKDSGATEEAIAWYSDQIHDDAFAEFILSSPVLEAKTSLKERGVSVAETNRLLASTNVAYMALGNAAVEPLVGFLKYVRQNSRSELVRLAASARLVNVGALRLAEESLLSSGTYIDSLKKARSKLVSLQASGVEMQQKHPKESDAWKKVDKVVGLLSSSLGGVNDQLYRAGYVDWEFPEIDTIDLNGKRMKLSQFRGKVVILDLWAFW